MITEIEAKKKLTLFIKESFKIREFKNMKNSYAFMISDPKSNFVGRLVYMVNKNTGAVSVADNVDTFLEFILS